MTKKQLTIFKEFFNNNYFREFRLLTENKKFNKTRFIQLGSKENLFMSSIIKFINRKHNQGKYDVYSHIYGFKDVDNLKKYRIQKKGKRKKDYDYSNDKPVRLYDRFFFDFDLDTSEYPLAKDLKAKINVAVLNNDRSQKKELMKEYLELLLNDELARLPFEELKILANYLDNEGIKYYPLFSGSKGFHLYIFFEPSLFNSDSFNVVANQYFEHFRDNLNLSTLDEAVFNNPTERISRPPYFKHKTTELYTYPICLDDSYNDIIEESFKPKIRPFKIANHVMNHGNMNLLDAIKGYVSTENIKQEIVRKEEEELREAQKKRTLKKTIEYRKKGEHCKEVEKDCRVIANEFLGSPEGQYTNYNTYHCFNHADNKPSLSVYKERFYCGVCGFKLNYAGFIMKYFNVGITEAMSILHKTF